MTDLGMTHFLTRNKYYLAVLMFKAVHGLVPQSISNNVLFNYEVSQRELRSFDNMNLYKMKPNCESFKHSLQYSGACVWNQLPLNVKEAETVNVFKKLYKDTCL